MPWLLYGSGLSALLVGVSPFALAVFAASAHLRGALTLAGHHRYFAHRAFRTGRGFQLFLAVVGASCLQGGPLSWAALHRHHHRVSDRPEDVISPLQHGFWWSQLHLWVGTPHAVAGRRVRDFDAFAELLWLERFWPVVPVAFGALLFAAGELLARRAPDLGTDGAQLLVWGLLVANAYMIQTASLVNSVCHRFGRAPYATGDGSRNCAWVGVLALGEGWHNNHHRFPGSARHGLEWWQLDGTWLLLRALAALGLVWDLRVPSAAARQRRRRAPPRTRPAASAATVAATHENANASPTRA